MTQTVSKRSLPLLLCLLRQFGEQQAEGVHQRRQQTPHQRLFPLRRTLSIHNQNARRLKHEQLVVTGQQRWEAVFLEETSSSSVLRADEDITHSKDVMITKLLIPWFFH